MIQYTVNLEGALLRDLQNLGAAAKPAAKAAGEKFIARVVPKATALAPDDPGTSGATSFSGDGSHVDLKRSVRGRVTTRKNGMVTVSVMAGGAALLPLLRKTGRKNPEAALAYAFVQHEDPTIRHPHGGQANFIGQPFMADAGTFADDLEKEIDARAR